MRSLLLFALMLPLLIFAAENRVPNSDFSEGDKAPDHWSEPDGVTSFYSRKGGNPGACIRFQTNVLQVDKKAFLEAEERAETAPEPRRPGKSRQYQTVGAHEGVWLYSAPIPIKPDDRYFVVAADVLGPARSTSLFYPQVFIRGYQRVEADAAGRHEAYFFVPHAGGPAFAEQFGTEQRPAVEGDYLDVYRHSLVCRIEAPGKWQHFELAFKLPGNKRYLPEVILLKCYAMWPLGEYRFDNVVLAAVDKEEYERVKKQGHSIRGFLKIKGE